MIIPLNAGLSTRASNLDSPVTVGWSEIAGRLGYFFCQVFPSESIILSGVPDVPLLEDMADRGKVTDLQNDVVAEFGERLGCCGMGHDIFEVEKAETSFEKGQTEWRDLFDI